MPGLLNAQKYPLDAPRGLSGRAGRRPPVRYFCRSTSILPPPCRSKMLPLLWGRPPVGSGFKMTEQAISARKSQQHSTVFRVRLQVSTKANSQQQAYARWGSASLMAAADTQMYPPRGPCGLAFVAYRLLGGGPFDDHADAGFGWAANAKEAPPV